MKIKYKYTPLILISIIMIYSLLNMYNIRLQSTLYEYHYIKQILWYILGFITIFICFKINIKKIMDKSIYLYILSIILLVLVLIFGKEINGAKSWFDFKYFSFQPSEFAKLTLALILSDVTNKFIKSKKKNELLYIIKIISITIVPSVLVFIEPDTGSLIFFILIFLVCFFSAKLNKKWYILFWSISISFTLSFILLYNFNQDLIINILGTDIFYRIDRLTNLNDNYQINNALTLIGSSSLFGSGLNSTSLYVPEAPTDFIFAYNIGNFGITGGFVVLIIYLLLSINLFYLNKKANNKLFANIFTTIFLFQVLYNILMNIGLLPIMGIPLPFLSYGGTTLLIYFLFLGIYYKTI